MEMRWTSLLLLLVLSCAQEPCIATHFDFTGSYTLGKQDELNRTFAKIQDKIQLGNVTFNSSETTTFTIHNIRTTFFYRDSKQRANITGNDTIIVYGGVVEAALTFSWIKAAFVTRNGTASANGISDTISFAKTIVIGNDSFYSYELLDAPDVTWSTGDVFSINRVDPADAS